MQKNKLILTIQTSNLLGELEWLKKTPEETKRISKTLAKLVSLEESSSPMKEYLHTFTSYNPFTFAQLQKLEQFVSNSLSIKYPETLTTTPSQQYLEDHFRNNSKLQFKTNAWIGRHNVDFFFPWHRLVIEVDGGIHNNEIKMRKDEHKYDALLDLGIRTTSIHSRDVKSMRHNLLNMLKDEANKVASRSKKVLMKKTAVFTVVSNLSKDDISTFIGININILTALLGKR